MFDDVVCLSHLRWGFVYQRPNHLMSRWARSHRVIFVEEPHFDASSPRLAVQTNTDRVTVAVPHLCPGTTPREAERLQRMLLGGLLERTHVRDPLLWYYTPMALGYTRGLRSSGVVYDCMDELSHFVGAPPELVARERHLFALADLVFTGGHSLHEAKRTHHPSVHAFPSSVDAAHFAKARRALPEPPDQASIPGPRIGFFGVVDERMDLDLVEAVAEARPDLSIVILGPVVKVDPAQLPRRPNLHWLGPKTYAELPGYIAGWDVAIMPFARNDATKFISPTKTLEYLAAGRPVVSTSIRDVVTPYGEQGLVRIADDPATFLAAVEAALSERRSDGDGASSAHAARDAFLAQTSWDITWRRMEALVRDAVSTRTKARSAHVLVSAGEDGPCSTF